MDWGTWFSIVGLGLFNLGLWLRHDIKLADMQFEVSMTDYRRRTEQDMNDTAFTAIRKRLTTLELEMATLRVRIAKKASRK